MAAPSRGGGQQVDPLTKISQDIAEIRKQNLLAAAYSVVGEREKGESFADYNALIRDVAFDIFDLGGSAAGNDVARILQTDVRVYRASILSVEKDPVKPGKEWSHRLLVTLGVKPSQYAKDGTEVVRTERIDSWDGSGRRVAKLAKDLVGHDAFVYIVPDGDFRYLGHLRDLGPTKDRER